MESRTRLVFKPFLVLRMASPWHGGLHRQLFLFDSDLRFIFFVLFLSGSRELLCHSIDCLSCLFVLPLLISEIISLLFNLSCPSLNLVIEMAIGVATLVIVLLLDWTSRSITADREQLC